MFTIDNDTGVIKIVKKDTAYFGLELDNYVLSQGDKVTFTVAKEKESQNPVIQKEITTFEDGVAVIFLTKEDTNLEKDEYFYDVQVDTKDGRVDTVMGPAKFKVVEGVTY